MDELDVEELVKRFIASTEASYADGPMERPPPPSPVDIKITEIFELFTCLEDCNITTEHVKNPVIIDNLHSNPRLTAVLKKSYFKDIPGSHLHFLPERTGCHYLRLYGGASHLEVAAIIAALFRQAETVAKKRKTPAPATLKALCANFPKKLFGGLLFEYRGIYISSSFFSCLSKSLSAWQYFFATGKMTEKHGFPGVITIQGDNFLIEDGYVIDSIGEMGWEYIDIKTQCTRAQLKVAFEKAQQDVRDFLVPLRSWAMRYYPEDVEELVACFTKAFVDRLPFQTASKFYQSN